MNTAELSQAIVIPMSAGVISIGIKASDLIIFPGQYRTWSTTTSGN